MGHVHLGVVQWQCHFDVFGFCGRIIEGRQVHDTIPFVGHQDHFHADIRHSLCIIAWLCLCCSY
jgi:hypothetical protein